MLKETFRPDHIWFVDDILGLKPGWIQRFADGVEREAMQTPFKSLGRVDLLLRGDTIDALRRARGRGGWGAAGGGRPAVPDRVWKGSRVGRTGGAAPRPPAPRGE